MDGQQTTALVRSDVTAIGRDREAIRARFGELPKLVISTQAEIEEIKNRGFLKRVFSNNTRDLANAMGHVVEVQQYTLAFVMTLIELHNDNVGMLRFLREQITQTRSELGMAVEQAGANSGEILAVQNTLDQVLDLVEARITKAAPRKSPWVAASVVVVILAVAGLLVWMKASGAW